MVTLSIADAAIVGISELVASAEEGQNVLLSRHGKVVAEVVSARELAELRQSRETLIDASLAMARLATDNGARTNFDDALQDFGLSREELELETAKELPAQK